MRYLKMRLLALVVIVIFAGLLYLQWRELRQEGRYSVKIAGLAPLGILGGLFMLLFPWKAGKPETGMDKLIVFLVFILGMAAGAVNLYLMDPGFFSFR
jgi:peptidoglycan/LPS O-acetylase OafA/YrhL